MQNKPSLCLGQHWAINTRHAEQAFALLGLALCCISLKQRPSACSALSPVGSGLAAPPGSIASSTPRSAPPTDRSGHTTRSFAPSLQAQMSRRARRSTSVGHTGGEGPSTGAQGPACLSKSVLELIRSQASVAEVQDRVACLSALWRACRQVWQKQSAGTPHLAATAIPEYSAAVCAICEASTVLHDSGNFAAGARLEKAPMLAPTCLHRSDRCTELNKARQQIMLEKMTCWEGAVRGRCCQGKPSVLLHSLPMKAAPTAYLGRDVTAFAQGCWLQMQGRASSATMQGQMDRSDREPL